MNKEFFQAKEKQSNTNNMLQHEKQGDLKAPVACVCP